MLGSKNDHCLNVLPIEYLSEGIHSRDHELSPLSFSPFICSLNLSYEIFVYSYFCLVNRGVFAMIAVFLAYSFLQAPST
jgi:hypothetical protein